MRNPNRIPVLLKELEIYWTANPDLRLCQILGNFFPGETDLYGKEDDLIIQTLKDKNEVT